MFEIILGGLIFHYQAVTNVKQTSFQKNMIVKYNNINLLVGNNSISKPIYGLGYDFKISDHTNFKVGGYIQDETDFNNLGVELSTGDFMPVVGIEHNFPITERISLTNMITPLIIFSGVRFKI